MQSVTDADYELQGLQAVKLSDKWGGGSMTWIIAGWPRESSANVVPDFSSIAVWTAESIDPPENVIAADAMGGMFTDLPVHDVQTMLDLIDQRAIDKPVHCTLNSLD